MSKIFSRIVISLLALVSLPAWGLFGSDKISSDTRNILKDNFPYRSVVTHLLKGKSNDIQGSFPNFNLRFMGGGERSGAKQEAYLSTRPTMVITQMISGNSIIFVAVGKRKNDIPVQKLIKASHDSKTYTVGGQKIETYFLGYGKEGGKKVKHIMDLEFNKALNMKIVNWKLVIDE